MTLISKSVKFCRSKVLILHGAILKETNCQMDRGMIIVSTLLWNANNEKRVEKALKAFYSKSRSISNFCSPKTKVDIYCDYIVPVVSDASETWSPTETDLRGVEKIRRIFAL